MSVRPVYFDGRGAGLGSFASDLRAAVDEADAAGDKAAVRKLRSFVLNYVEVKLATKSARQLEAYLAAINIWRETEYWNVYRVPDSPSICFAAKIGSDGTVLLMPVGVCYRYPENDPDVWWRDVIEPRVRSLVI